MFSKTELESSVEVAQQRFTLLITVGSLITGFLADFFSPIGAQYLTFSIAVLCAIVLLVLFFKGEAFSNWLKGSYFEDYFPCQKKCYKTPLFQYLLVIIFICGGSSLITAANAKDGGVMASSFDQVRAYQSMMGIMVSVRADVSQIRKDTSDIKGALDTLEKETSDNPRKELAKLGMQWHPYDYYNAAIAGDLETVRLFSKTAIKNIGDFSNQCMMLPGLLMGYTGSKEAQAAIWEEVLISIGNDAINEECDVFLKEEINRSRPEIKKKITQAIEHYTSVYGVNDYRKVSLLMIAVWIGDSEMVELFLKHGAQLDRGVEALDMPYPHGVISVNISPLSEANRLNLVEISEFLRNRGAREFRSSLTKYEKRV